LRSIGRAKRNLTRRSIIIYTRTLKKSIKAYSTLCDTFLLYFDISKIKERKLSTIVAGIVERFDLAYERAVKRTGDAAIEGSRWFRFVRIIIDRRNPQLLKHFAIIVMVAVAVLSLFNYATGFEYSYNGKVLGVVKDQADVIGILEVVSKQLSEEHGVSINIEQDSNIEFRKIVTLDREIDDMEKVLTRLTYMKSISVNAYGIFVNGKRAAVLPSQAEARGVLAGLLEKFSTTKDGVRYEKVMFQEEVTVKEATSKLGNLERSAEASTKLLADDASEKIHLVTVMDSKASIANLYNLPIAKLEADNPTIKDRELIVGEKLTIQKNTSVLHVATVEKATYDVIVPYTTERKDDPNEYKGVNTIKTAGKDGITKIEARIIRINGVEKEREILKETVTTEPVVEVILVGTKPIPPTMGDGQFINPCPAGRLTSTYGYRWGRMHWGVDLACPVGTTVRAADGGTIVFAGWGSAEGYYIKINHQNGFQTTYKHLSKILVQTGQKVYEGQTIAKSGNTGNSTGPHLHFEIFKNGINVNPFDYI